MSFFKKIISMIGGESITGGSDRAVGIDIGTSSIKLVELRKKGGKAVLETYSTLALGPYAKLDVGALTNLSGEELTKALTDALHEGGVAVTDSALSIPSAASLLFLISLPGTIGEKELPTVVPTEARKYIPVPITEVTIDYWEIPSRREFAEDGKAEEIPQEVLVAAIHNETLSKYRAVADGAKLNADVFEIEVFSSIRSTFKHELSCVLFMDFGASKTKLAIVEYGIVRSFHIINRGSADITNTISKSLNMSFAKAEDLKRDVGLMGERDTQNISDSAFLVVDYILSETRSAIQNFERKENKAITKVILSGAGVLLKGFVEHATNTFHTETVLGNPFDKVEVPEFVANILKETGPEFSVALGLALRKLGQ